MQKLIFGNWKMNLSETGAIELAQATSKIKIDASAIKVALFPTFTALPGVAAALKGTDVGLGGQDCFWETTGAFTGEVSPTQLKELNCTHVLVGHSERRQSMNETDEMVNRKLRSALSAGLTPVMCVGETDNDRRSGQWSNVIARQVAKGLADVKVSGNQEIVIAYEPVWAIGSGRACSPENAREAHALVRNAVIELFAPAVAQKNFRIIYGGSVDEKNIASYLALEGIDGALVGGASQRAASFAGLIEAVQK